LSLFVGSLSREAKYFAYPTLHELLTFHLTDCAARLRRSSQEALGDFHLLVLFLIISSFTHILLQVFEALNVDLEAHSCLFTSIFLVAYFRFFWG